MPPNQLLLIASLGEGALAVVALTWMWWRDILLVMGEPVSGTVFGSSAAAALALLNCWLLRGAPDVGPVRRIRVLYREVFTPLFARVRPVHIVLISLLAAIGEELLFRGAMQAEVGLVGASLMFGILHLGGGGTLAFGCWAAVMGFVLGGLANWSHGLLAPIIAHALYDVAAIAYIRWGNESS
jgi:membrane protease YdiL (CAAX protease family)